MNVRNKRSPTERAPCGVIENNRRGWETGVPQPALRISESVNY